MHPIVELRLSLAALSLALVACGSGTIAPPAGGTSTTSTTSGDAGAGGGSTAQVDRGPTSIKIDGDPNGLWWDAASQTLFVADDNGNRILKWTDKGGIALLGALPTAPQNGPGLGQLVRTSDGTIYVTRFGYGTAGDVAFLKPDGSSGKVPNLDVTKRRIGLGIADDGTLFDTYFVKSASGNLGAVARLDPSGSEPDVMTGLGKPVGVLATGGALVVSDQSAGKILKAPIATPSAVTVVAVVATPDLLCAGPAGTLFTGGLGGTVRQIQTDGTATSFATGFLSVRGVAYDADHKRLFVSNHDPNGTANTLAIVPVN